MKYQINQRVRTPIGEGIYQGVYRAVMAAVEKHLVRLPVNEKTAPHLQDENCITPRAAKMALFTFDPSELGGGVVEALILIAIVAVILLCLGSLLGVPWPW
jgi:hypothetical protein